jgi:hypothetical protein
MQPHLLGVAVVPDTRLALPEIVAGLPAGELRLNAKQHSRRGGEPIAVPAHVWAWGEPAQSRRRCGRGELLKSRRRCGRRESPLCPDTAVRGGEPMQSPQRLARG